MKRRWSATTVLGLAMLTPLMAQQPPPGGAQPPQPPGGPGGPGGGPGFFGGPGMQQERKLVKQFDKNGDGWLNLEERAEARAFLKKERESGGGRGGPGGMRPFGGFGRGNQDPPKPGPRLLPADVRSFPDAPLYEPNVLRTLFLEFENKDWEAELQDFHGTDVEVPAILTVDGKKYPNVGVHFRGMSSYMMVPTGSKRSLNLTIDLVDRKQRLLGYKTLNLLNSHDDPTFLDAVLYSHIARQYMPAPKGNLVKVAINGESWGLYANVQQFNREFTQENYKTTKGARWKVRGNPMARSGLEYNGDDVEEYKRRYQLKSDESAKDWQALIALCKTLNETPPDKLEAALRPILDVDEVLRFLALDVALINCDGYWIRSSDYSIFRDPKGIFHILPSDMNEAFRTPMGPGMGGPGGPGGRGGRPGGPGTGGPGGGGAPGGLPPGGPGGPQAIFVNPGGFAMTMPRPGELLPAFLQEQLKLSEEQKKQLGDLQKDVDAQVEKLLTAEQRKQLKDLPPGGPGGFGGPPMAGLGPRGTVELDPLVGLEDARRPLRSKLLAVPALRAKYLGYVKAIAQDSLDWKHLGPVVARYRQLIEQEVEADTRKLDSFEEFKQFTADVADAQTRPSGRPTAMNLRAFADQRRTFLLNHPEIKKLAP